MIDVLVSRWTLALISKSGLGNYPLSRIISALKSNEDPCCSPITIDLEASWRACSGLEAQLSKPSSNY